MDGPIYVCLDCHEEFDEPHQTCPACGEEMSPNAKVPPDARYGVYILRTACDRCGQPLPLNGPRREVTCGACHNTNRFEPERWKSLLEDFLEEYDDFGWADSRSSTIMSGSRTFELTYGKQLPHCPHCHKTLPTFDLPAGADELLTCAKCGAKVATFPAPDWLKAVLPAAVQLYGAEREAGQGPDGSVAAEVAEAARPVVMQCPQCGGALKITAASERLVPCEYCQVDVYLPDDLWNRLHPVKTSDRWMVRYAGPARAAPVAADEEPDSNPDVFVPEPEATQAQGAAERGGGWTRSWLFWLLLTGAGVYAIVHLLLHWHT